MTTTGSTARIQSTRPAPVDWTAAGVYQGRTSASFLDDCAASVPDRLALVEGDQRLTYKQFFDRANALASGLRARGIDDGDVVTMEVPNWWESCVVYQALSRLGCVVNPVVPIYRDHEMAFIIGQAAPTAVVIPHRFRGFDYVEMLERLLADADGAHKPIVIVLRPEGPLPDGFVAFDDVVGDGAVDIAGDADDICLLLYTSGTTADPKGVLHSHNTLVYEVQSIIDLCRLAEGDTVLMPAPVTQITGFLYA